MRGDKPVDWGEAVHWDRSSWGDRPPSVEPLQSPANDQFAALLTKPKVVVTPEARTWQTVGKPEQKVDAVKLVQGKPAFGFLKVVDYVNKPCVVTNPVHDIATSDGELVPLDAPFTRRKCIAFHIELVTRESFGNSVTWRRVFQDAVGQVILVGPAVRLAVSQGKAGGDEGKSTMSGLVGVAQNSAGSMENVRTVVTGEVEAGLVQADVAAWAFQGEHMFAQQAKIILLAFPTLRKCCQHLIQKAALFTQTTQNLLGKIVVFGNLFQQGLVHQDPGLPGFFLQQTFQALGHGIGLTAKLTRDRDGQTRLVGLDAGGGIFILSTINLQQGP